MTCAWTLTKHHGPELFEFCILRISRITVESTRTCACSLPFINPFPDRETGQARHGRCLFWACSLRPGDARCVFVSAANLSDIATAQELESHTNAETDSRSAARVNSRDHQRVDSSDNVFRSLCGAGAAGTLFCVKCGELYCQCSTFGNAFL